MGHHQNEQHPLLESEWIDRKWSQLVVVGGKLGHIDVEVKLVVVVKVVKMVEKVVAKVEDSGGASFLVLQVIQQQGGEKRPRSPLKKRKLL